MKNYEDAVKAIQGIFSDMELSPAQSKEKLEELSSIIE